jgi:lipopolysaccharide export system protein LptC
MIELSGIHGQVELENRGETSLRAKTGIYDMKAGVLRLSEGIEIGATGGYQISLTDALVEVRKGHIVTDKPVRAVFPDGSLQAQRLEIFDHGDRARFDGGVVLIFRMPPPNDAREARTAEAAK